MHLCGPDCDEENEMGESLGDAIGRRYMEHAGAGTAAGKSSSVELPEHLSWLPEYLDEVLELVAERGRKYGPGNIREFGELGVLVRLSDKLSRLRHTTENFADETSADSWMDVIGYGLIGLAWSRGDWPGSEKA